MGAWCAGVLQELSRVLNGDNKTEVIPIFNVTMVLERSNRVELQPTIQTLFDMIHKVSRDLITVIQCMPRVALQLTDKQRKDMEVRAAHRAIVTAAPYGLCLLEACCLCGILAYSQQAAFGSCSLDCTIYLNAASHSLSMDTVWDQFSRMSQAFIAWQQLVFCFI
jgi:hypothetical protein